MSVEGILLGLQITVLAYFSIVVSVSFVLAWRGIRALSRSSRETAEDALEDLVAQGTYRPISILVPARNEAKTIVESIRSLLLLRFPEFEIIVVSDGSTDETIPLLEGTFALEEQSRVFSRSLPTQPIRRMFRSRFFTHLTVVEKEAGGKADALNAALNLARYPLVCTLDADTLVEPDALLRAVRIFCDDERVIAVGGAVRPLNGARVEDGLVKRAGLPRKWIERIQLVEYARAFGVRSGWGSWNALLLISGAFGLFRRESLLKIRGYRTTTVAEDLDLVIRLHMHFREEGIPYRILSLAETMCWTQVPEDLKSLRRQRNRWQRGLWQTLWSSRSMLFRTRFGRLGWGSLPFYWLFEGAGPLVEILGYVSIIASIALGTIDPFVALSLLVVALSCGAMLSFLGLVTEGLQGGHPGTVRERLALHVAAVLELVGPRQIIVWERFVAFFQAWTRRGRWGSATRHSIGEGAVVHLPPRRAFAPESDEEPEAKKGTRPAG